MIRYRTKITKARRGLNKHRYALTLEWSPLGLFWLFARKTTWTFRKWQSAHRLERFEKKLAYMRHWRMT